jgi:hypothetical protein
MDTNVTGGPGTAAVVAARVGAPGTDAAGDASVKILGNISDISSMSKAVGGAGGRDRSGGSGTWGGGNLGTGGDAGGPTAANGYKFVSENLTGSKMLQRIIIVTCCFVVTFQGGVDIACGYAV